MANTPRIVPPVSKRPRKPVTSPRPLGGTVLVVWGGEATTLEESGELVIGRASDCDVILDDPLVSRRHAMITVRVDGVFVEDLLSANGVYVNGIRVQRMQQLFDGDRILLATRELSVFEQRPGSVPPSEARISRVPLKAIKSAAVTGQANPFSVIGGFAEQMFEDGRITDAARVLEEHLNAVLEGARSALVVPEQVCEAASIYALRLGRVTARGRWVDYAVELYLRARRPMPSPVIDALCEALKQVEEVDGELFHRYLEILRAGHHGMNRNELESVNRLACLNLPGSSERR